MGRKLDVNIDTPHIDTRSVIKRRRLDKSFVHVACQTEPMETLPNIPVRKSLKKGGLVWNHGSTDVRES